MWSKGNWSFLRLLSLTSRICLPEIFKFTQSNCFSPVTFVLKRHKPSFSLWGMNLKASATSLSLMLCPHCPFSLGCWRITNITNWYVFLKQSTEFGIVLDLPSRTDTRSVFILALLNCYLKFFAGMGSPGTVLRLVNKRFILESKPRWLFWDPLKIN